MELKPNKGEMLWIARNEKTKMFLAIMSTDYETVRLALCSGLIDPRIIQHWEKIKSNYTAAIYAKQAMAEKWFPILISEGWDIVKITAIHTAE
jgi:hypothetical protein